MVCTSDCLVIMASVIKQMIESRLGLELNSLTGLKKQAQSFLACINSLRLVNTKYQWIVKPGHGTSNNSTPKRGVDGEEKEVTKPTSMEVLELKDIEKELLLTQVRLKLCTFNQGNSDTATNLPLTPGPTPIETVSLLVSTNLYMDAVNLCTNFHLPKVLG